jgi:exonuclease III
LDPQPSGWLNGERVEKGVATVVHKSIVRSVVKKTVYNDRIIAIKLQAQPINILMIQVYMPTSEHEDEVEELHDIIEEILEDDGKGDTNTIIMGDWNSVVGDESFRNTVGPHGLGRRNHRGQMLINFCERNGMSPTHGSESLREDCTHGRHQEIGVNISWTTYL